ncbi:MAG: hypothetical protein HN868_18910 [Gammaproteobacteria bacterium]|jgi:hypothetical protein|nr:hypothetical protein [Gammaproteobacteria bacterium]
MENIKNKMIAYTAAMNLIEFRLGKEIFTQLNLSAKETILNTLQQELLKYDIKKLLQICDYNLMPQSKLGHSLSGATRAKPLLLKGSINPLRVRGRFVAIQD